MRRLLDTSAHVAFRNGNKRTGDLATSCENLDFSVIVIAELLYGFHVGSRLRQNVEALESLLDHPRVSIAFVGRTTADRYGRISASLRSAGTPIPTNDIWIAAQALELGSELITFDRHFERVPGLVLTFPDA